MKWKTIMAFTALGMVGSCEVGCACSDPIARAIVFGTVLDRAGAPVPNVDISARMDGSCGDEWTPTGVLTSSSGVYELTLYASRRPPTVLCFDLYATVASEPQDTAWVRGQRLEAEFSPMRTLVDLRF